jgi:hypothetical protein
VQIAGETAFFLTMFFLALISFSIVTAMVAVVKGVIAIYSLILSPIEIISNIPGNWRRVVFCTDVATAPELIDVRNPSEVQGRPAAVVRMYGP